MSSLAGAYSLVIADRGWSDRRELRVASVGASWRLNAPGILSATMAADTAWLLDVADFNGLWVRWDHSMMGPWGGRVTDTRVNFDTGTVELSCESFLTTLKNRRTRKSERTVNASPGSLVYRAFGDVSSNDLPFDSILCDTGGSPVTMQWRADDLYGVVTRLASTNGYQFDATLDPDEWTVDFQFRRQVGRDMTGSVILIEGYQIAGGTSVRSSASLVNDILAVDGDAAWDDVVTIPVVDPDSIQTYGRRQDTVRYYGLSTRESLYSRAKLDLETATDPVTPVSFKLSDREPQLADIRCGDTIRVLSASANAEWIVSITGRAVDADTGVVTLVGDALAA